MTKIFISGSRIISNKCSIKNKIDNIIKLLKDIYGEELNIFVGDCYGIDLFIQEYCKKYNIKCYVFFIGNKPRNLISNNFILVPCKGYRYIDKDIEMSNKCDVGICFWNGKSQGTRMNIERLNKLNKAVKVINI